MIRTIAFLSLVVAASAFSFSDLYLPNLSFPEIKISNPFTGLANAAITNLRESVFAPKLKLRFGVEDLNPISTEDKAFMEQPVRVEVAKEAGWELKAGPGGDKGFEALALYCPPGPCPYSICLYYDENGDVAGELIAINPNKVTDLMYDDWKAQGYKEWIVEHNGETQKYYVLTIYFSCAEYLEQEPAKRKASRDPTKLLQSEFICVSGPDGLQRISTDGKVIADTTLSNFTEQACIPAMGHHYYYKMTEDLVCDAKLFKFFPLVYCNRLIGLGCMTIMGKQTIEPNCTNYFEAPPDSAVKIIVPRGPQCLYNIAKKPTLGTLHSYFMASPIGMLCVGESLFCNGV